MKHQFINHLQEALEKFGPPSRQELDRIKSLAYQFIDHCEHLFFLNEKKHKNYIRLAREEIEPISDLVKDSLEFKQNQIKHFLNAGEIETVTELEEDKELWWDFDNLLQYVISEMNESKASGRAVVKKNVKELKLDLSNYFDPKYVSLIEHLKRSFPEVSDGERRTQNFILLLFVLNDQKLLSIDLTKYSSMKLYHILTNTFGNIGTDRAVRENVKKIRDYYSSSYTDSFIENKVKEVKNIISKHLDKL